MTVDQDWTVALEHRVAGTPETVFEYFTDPEKYRRWKGIDAELDARPGGIYRVTMAPGVWVRGEYVLVEPPHLLVMTWGFESTQALPRGLAQVPPGSSTVEFRFELDGDGTIVRIRHRGLPTEEAHFAHELGWKSYLPRLMAVRQDGDPGEHPVIAMAETLFRRDAELGDSPY
jgi:uncharacterized protein YndB with AHSA1/START domain